MVTAALDAAYEAVVWAMDPHRGSEHITNYQALQSYVHNRVARGDGIGRLPVADRYQACLARMLIMGDPTLVSEIKPKYVDELDCQAGTAMLCVYYHQITSQVPKVRSWRHALQEVGR